MTARRRLSVQSLEANLRLYLKELGASYMFELLQMRNADGKNDNFLFFCSFEFIILQMCCKLTTNQPCVHQPRTSSIRNLTQYS